MKRIIDKLNKIEALARSGIGGEKEVAQRMLDALCRKHNIILEQIIKPEKEYFKFVVKNKIDEMLLRQIVVHVCQATQINNMKDGNKRYYELTKLQTIDIEDAFKHYRKEWENQLKESMIAFIHANHIYGPESNTNKQKPTPDSMEQFKRIMVLMRGMKPQPWEGRKRLDVLNR